MSRRWAAVGALALGLCAGALLLVGVLVTLVAGNPALVLSAMAALAVALVTGAHVFRVSVALPRAPRPAHPVLFYNPRSGGGKVARLHLREEARARGFETIELKPGADLERLVRDAVDRGADALAMAGGDGSQATVARIAAERGLPYACIPAGTRNHFALDLGVDRGDVVGALDAFVDGGERLVDLGEVNGRTFVNNVSLGVYGEAVQRAGYRNAKVRTLLETVPDVLGPGKKPDLRWLGPDGEQHEGAAAAIVSNNAYRLGHGVGDGTRPRLDGGSLGVAVLAAPAIRPGCGPGRRGPSSSTRPNRCPLASTARPSCWMRRCASESGPPPCAAVSRGGTPARRLRPSSRPARGRLYARSPPSPPGTTLAPPRRGRVEVHARAGSAREPSPRPVGSSRGLLMNTSSSNVVSRMFRDVQSIWRHAGGTVVLRWACA